MREFTICSNSREELIDITEDVQRIIDECNVRNGIVIVYVPHTTAAVTVNEGADKDVQRDTIATLNRLIPREGGYRHAEGNSDAHIKSSLLGASQTILIRNGKLLLGTWQRIFFFEGDGPRTRRVIVEVIPL
ncbi:MAG TPA: YjbQ family protein [Thermoplasmatales archaeon]|nr:YjbQ family protein [Thermoplasmatales archaeon]